MTVGSGSNVYERAEWRSVGDGLLRPGGFALTDRAIAYCALPAGSRVWDIGCGLGATVAHLTTRHALTAVGVDHSEALLDEARSRTPWLPLVCAPGDALPCPTGELDAVMAECAWSSLAGDAGVHVDREDRVLAEFRRVLRQDGWLIISDVYARTAARLPPAPLGEGCWRTLPTEGEIRSAIASQGFTLALWEDHSAALGEFAARMIFEHGSLRPLWGEAGEGPGARAALKAARPGYFLLIARRD